MQEALDQLADSVGVGIAAKGAIVAGSASSFIFGMNSEAVGVVAGIIIGLSGLAYNIWSTERKLKIMRDRKQDDV